MKIDELKVTITITNLDKIKSAMEKAEKAIKDLKDALWEISNLKSEIEI